MMEYLDQLGPLVLASRLKNLSDTLMQGVARVYREMEIDFEPRWFPVTYYLYHIGPAQLTQLAKASRQTHPAIHQVVRVMQKKGLVRISKDDKDLRKTIIALSSRGMEMARNLEETWEVISLAVGKLLEDNYIQIIENIALMEDELDREDIYFRVKRQYVMRHLSALEIRGFNVEDSAAFREIHLQWLKETVGVSDYDRHFLNNPGQEVMARGGKIYMAYAGNELAGTVSLIPLNNQMIELTKLAVKKHCRRLGIGRRLTSFAIGEARKMGFSSLVLLTHPVLKEAIDLYQDLGFVRIDELPDLPDHTGRCSLTMQLNINIER